jgi:hypothetical protein
MLLARRWTFDAYGRRCTDLLQPLFEIVNVVEELAVLVAALDEAALQRSDQAAQALRLSGEPVRSLVAPRCFLTERAHGFVQDLELTLAGVVRRR